MIEKAILNSLLILSKNSFINKLKYSIMFYKRIIIMFSSKVFKDTAL